MIMNDNKAIPDNLVCCTLPYKFTRNMISIFNFTEFMYKCSKIAEFIQSIL